MSVNLDSNLFLIYFSLFLLQYTKPQIFTWYIYNEPSNQTLDFFLWHEICYSGRVFINPVRPSDAMWRQWSWSPLVQVKAGCPSNHYLNQCWLLDELHHKQKLQWYLNQNRSSLVPANIFSNTSSAKWQLFCSVYMTSPQLCLCIFPINSRIL